MTARESAERVLGAHTLTNGFIGRVWVKYLCTCGADVGSDDGHRAHVVEALDDAGVLASDTRAHVEALIEASSLGSPQAKAARESVPDEVGIAIARAADWMGRHRALLAALEALAEHWAGCWCGPQESPDHDPRRQDCPRHGDGAAAYFSEGIVGDLRALVAQHRGERDGGQAC